MSRFRRILTDPSFYGILALNLYFIMEFRKDPSQYQTLIWLYWSQSIVIGFFSFLEITTRKFDQGDLKVKDSLMKQGCSTGLFFVLHYGFFHFVYFIFLASDTGFRHVDFGFFKTAIICVFLSQLVFFVQHKFDYKNHPPSMGRLFVQPYIRIIPMHLTILLPAFIGVAPSLIFIILRSILDIVGYLVTSPHYKPARAEVVGNPDAGVIRRDEV